MENQNEYNANQYLMRFDQILNTMENKMLSGRVTFNITKDFIRNMIPHHEAAILMCRNLLNYTKNTRLRNLAQTIIQTQTEEISQMRTIDKNSSNDMNDSQSSKAYNDLYLMIARRMIKEMRESARTLNIDLDFITEMIPHHEGAVLMCQNVLMFPINPRLRQLARDIITQQTRGIAILTEIRNQMILR